MHSQNNLKSRILVEKLVDMSDFGNDDLVLDIGAGTGILSSVLAKRVGQIRAFEIDKKLEKVLRTNLVQCRNVRVTIGDFLKQSLPNYSFKVFSNIPFNRTSDILKTLFEDSYFEQGFFIIQREASFRFAGEQVNSLNTMLSVIYGVEFKFENIYLFKRSDFTPKPAIEIVMMKVTRNDRLLIDLHDREDFRNFVSYIYSNSKGNVKPVLNKLFTYKQVCRMRELRNMKPSEISIARYVELYALFKQVNKAKYRYISGHYKKILRQQSGIQKIYKRR